MITLYTSPNYAPHLIKKRYVRASVGGGYCWCEVGDDPRYNLRTGIVEGNELPAPIKVEADVRRGLAFSYVEWLL